MVQAEAKYYPNLGMPDFHEVQQTRQVKRTYKKVNQGRKILIVGGSLLLAYALFLVFLCIQSDTLSYQIYSLEKDVSQLQTTQNRINYQIAEAQSLDRVQKIAEQQLGMTKPAINSSLLMETENKPVVVANKGSKSTTMGYNFLERLSSNMSRLAQKMND
jgi:cell division protein FtsL